MNNNKQKAKQRMTVRKMSILACVQAMVIAIVTLQGLPALAENAEPKAQTKVENSAEKKESTPMDFFKGEPDTAYPGISLLLTNVTGRDYQSLNGEWNIVIDEAGMAWRLITKHDYFSSGAGIDEFQQRLLEASFDDSDTLVVPGDWNSQRLDLDRYRSRILYQKDVSLEPQEDKRYFLHFGAANYTTDVFVNDELVGRHIGGYTSFNFDITPYVKSGNNVIIARVDAHLDETTIPTMRTSDFWKYGGIIGDVGLVTVDNTFIENYHVYLADRETNTIQGWVQLAGDNIADQSIELSIKKLGVEAVATTNAKGRASFNFSADKLKLWSPNSPQLYNVSLALGDDVVSEEIGFRTIETDGLNIVLNGEPIRLRGISMHQETPLKPGVATSREDAKANFKLVKELNANFVRLAHYPHNEHTVRLADELGLLIWSEVPIVSLIDWDSEETFDEANNQLSENITRDLNRASIIMWSLSNESFPQSEARLAFLTKMAETARALDESKRPLASALVGGQGEEFKHLAKHAVAEILKHPDLSDVDRQRVMAMAKRAGGTSDSTQNLDNELLTIEVSDPLGKVIDIAGYNEYFGWYYSKSVAAAMGIDEMLVRDAMINLMPKVRFTNPYGKPMIISEFGAGAKYGLHSDEALLWSEEYQAKVYRAQLDMLEKSKYVQGYSPWILKDFRSHLRELNDIQDTYNRKGLVSEKGEKKLAFDVLKKHYKKIQ